MVILTYQAYTAVALLPMAVLRQYERISNSFTYQAYYDAQLEPFFASNAQSLKDLKVVSSKKQVASSK